MHYVAKSAVGPEIVTKQVNLVLRPEILSKVGKSVLRSAFLAMLANPVLRLEYCTKHAILAVRMKKRTKVENGVSGKGWKKAYRMVDPELMVTVGKAMKW